jgi:hypothetical protein
MVVGRGWVCGGVRAQTVCGVCVMSLRWWCRQNSFKSSSIPTQGGPHTQALCLEGCVFLLRLRTVGRRESSSTIEPTDGDHQQPTLPPKHTSTRGTKRFRQAGAWRNLGPHNSTAKHTPPHRHAGARARSSSSSDHHQKRNTRRPHSSTRAKLNL